MTKIFVILLIVGLAVMVTAQGLGRRDQNVGRRDQGVEQRDQGVGRRNQGV